METMETKVRTALEGKKQADLRDLCQMFDVAMPAMSKNSDLVNLLLDRVGCEKLADILDIDTGGQNDAQTDQESVAETTQGGESDSQEEKETVPAVPSAPAKCPRCGVTDVTAIGDGLYKCNRPVCHWRFPHTGADG